MVKPAILGRFDLFRPLDARACEALAARAVVRQFRAGQTLWRAGDQARGLYLVLDGRVRVVRNAGARQHVVHVEERGATLGEVPLFADGGYPASAEAVEPTTCVVIDRTALRAVMASHPELAWALLGRLAVRVRQLVDRLSSRTEDSLQARLASYLLSRPQASSGAIVLGGTQQAVAEELGTVREIIVRQLRQMVEAGLLEQCGRGQYVVRNATGLSLVAQSGRWRRRPKRRR